MEKISSQIMGELARILREEVTDPRVSLVTITRVDVAPDLSNAVVFYSVMSAKPGDVETIEQVDDGLHSAASFFRRRAARVLPLRRMPELRFRYDPSLALGTETLALLRDIDYIPEDEDASGSEATATSVEQGDGEKA
jgi:ribosome-binding factor A